MPPTSRSSPSSLTATGLSPGRPNDLTFHWTLNSPFPAGRSSPRPCRPTPSLKSASSLTQPQGSPSQPCSTRQRPTAGRSSARSGTGRGRPTAGPSGSALADARLTPTRSRARRRRAAKSLLRTSGASEVGSETTGDADDAFCCKSAKRVEREGHGTGSDVKRPTGLYLVDPFTAGRAPPSRQVSPAPSSRRRQAAPRRARHGIAS